MNWNKGFDTVIYSNKNLQNLTIFLKLQGFYYLAGFDVYDMDSQLVRKSPPDIS